MQSEKKAREGGHASFQPQWTVRKGAQELYDAYRAELGFEDVQRGRYVRISHIQRLLNAGQLDASLRWSRCSRHPRPNGL